MSLLPPLTRVSLAAFLALAATASCIHATGKLPDGPPPEYEETPAPASLTSAPSVATSATVPTPATTGTPPPATSGSPPPVR
jgi:hypothetical protein